MKISRVGYARCSSCLSHVRIAEDSACPFCGDEIKEASTIGENAMQKLRSSRSALIAMGLAGGLTFAVACGEADPKEPTNPNNTTSSNSTNGDSDMGDGVDMNEEDPFPNNVTADYGLFDPGALVPGDEQVEEEESSEADMG